tara:strand:+ start:6041 stop:6178 length:138 start_codon:yes stop_codon:yes gene_type:complete
MERKMSVKKRNETAIDPREMETIIARARRERDAHLRNFIGSLFGR